MLDNLFSQLNNSSEKLEGCESTRLFHGRGHCFEGLEFINVDWFAPVIWVVIYGDVEENIIEDLNERFISFAKNNSQVSCVSMQHRIKGRAQQDIIYGELPEQCFAHEEGVKYALKFSENQNIGFFLDAKPGRQWLRQQAKGKHVLNLFSYTCSFSVAAM